MNIETLQGCVLCCRVRTEPYPGYFTGYYPYRKCCKFCTLDNSLLSMPIGMSRGWGIAYRYLLTPSRGTRICRSIPVGLDQWVKRNWYNRLLFSRQVSESVYRYLFLRPIGSEKSAQQAIVLTIGMSHCRWIPITLTSRYVKLSIDTYCLTNGYVNLSIDICCFEADSYANPIPSFRFWSGRKNEYYSCKIETGFLCGDGARIICPFARVIQQLVRSLDSKN